MTDRERQLTAQEAGKQRSLSGRNDGIPHPHTCACGTCSRTEHPAQRNLSLIMKCDRCRKQRARRDLLTCNHCGDRFCIVDDVGETCADRHEEGN